MNYYCINRKCSKNESCKRYKGNHNLPTLEPTSDLKFIEKDCKEYIDNGCIITGDKYGSRMIIYLLWI
ncbi:MAG: hypothetical protein JSW06_02970 [Thermoplasmatales archaeon]|nr:MAG: hypothetical protein JSW06_02970 [Thermoplasmatales archaeon]